MLKFGSRDRQEVTASLAITAQRIEGLVFSIQTQSVVNAFSMVLPEDIMSATGDEVVNPQRLAQVLMQVHKEIGKPKAVNLSVPATLLRVVEMPKLNREQTLIALSSEAERFVNFDNTEAIVDYNVLGAGAKGAQKLVCTAIRKDSLDAYMKAFQMAKIKVLRMSVEPVEVLRALAGTGVLPALADQIGEEAYWGGLLVAPERLYLSIWQADQLIDLREVQMNNVLNFNRMSEDAVLMADVVEEVRRTTKVHPPAVWLTHGLTQPTCQLLGQALGCPVQPGRNSMGFEGADAVTELSSLGAALTEFVLYPFQFNLLNHNKASVPEASTSSKPSPVAPIEPAKPNLAVGFALGVAVLLGLVWVGCMVYQGQLSGQLAQLEQEKSTESQKLATLQAQLNAEKQKFSVQAALVKVAQNARQRNRAYEHLAEDLRVQAPTQLWLSQIQAGTQISFAGKAMNHQAILDFAKSFDGVPYAQSILIDRIEEKLVGTTPVFEFVISGQVTPNPGGPVKEG